MPTYEYRCKDCDHGFEIVQSFSDDSLTVCPECGGALKKVFGNVGITFKGGGFYKTDSRSGAASNGGAESSSTTSSDGGSSDAGSSSSGSKESTGSSGSSTPATTSTGASSGSGASSSGSSD